MSVKWGGGRARARSVICACALTTLASTATATAARPDDEALRRAGAAKAGVPAERLEVRDRLTQALPITGRTLEVAKLEDEKTGDVHVVAIDEQGRSVSFEAAQAAESDARAARDGRLDQRLVRRVRTARADERIAVSIWLDEPPVTPRPAGRNVEQRLADAAARSANARKPVVDELRRMGARPQEPQYSPAVFATLTPGQIRRLEKHPSVAFVYPGREDYRELEDDAATTHGVNPIWASGNLGFGPVRPVDLERMGISDENPNLNNLTHPVIFYCSSVSTRCPNGKFLNNPAAPDHASKVAGAYGSTHPLARGIAPNAQVLLSANSQDFTDANLVAANEWARGNGGDPTNMSFGLAEGVQTFFSRYVDWAARNLGQTFTAAAGNNNDGTFRVDSPGTAYSAITVGAFSDGNDGFWANDVLSSFSDHVNPSFATGLQKPEVVAVGQGLTLTNRAGLSGGTDQGTSFAAPQIAGQVALMLARRPGQNGWPETNKAAVLASAYHDIETASGQGKDGLGAPVMHNSDETYRLGRFINECGSGCGPLLPADFPGSFRNHPVSLTAGQRVKVAIAWDSNSNGSSSDVLGADIDLTVLTPSGSVACASQSIQNAWESCEFTAPVTGTYNFRERLTRADAGWPGTFVGMAWSIRTLPTMCWPPARAFGATGGSFTLSSANGPTYFDSYPGWSLLQTGREQWFSFATTAPRTFTFTDTDPNVDLHVLRLTCSPTSPNPTFVGHGASTVTVNNAPAGVYWLVGDGRNGHVSTSNTYRLTVSG